MIAIVVVVPLEYEPVKNEKNYMNLPAIHFSPQKMSRERLDTKLLFFLLISHEFGGKM